MLRHAAVAAFLLALAARPSFADVAGPATVVDGDTLVVAGKRIRLQGIDAPELHQTCTAYGEEWACGRTSAEWLKEQRTRPVCRSGLLRRRRETQRADRPRGLGARFPTLLDQLPAG